MPKIKKQFPLAIANQRIETIAQWFATDPDDLSGDELTEWRKWFSSTGPTAEEAIARALAPIAEGGLGIPRRDRAQKAVSKAMNQWSVIPGRPANTKLSERQTAQLERLLKIRDG